MYITSRVAEPFEAKLFSVNTTQTCSHEDYTFLLVQYGAFHILDGSSKYVLAQDDIILLYPQKEYTFQFLSRNQAFLFRCRKTFLDNYIPSGMQLECNSSLGKKDDFTALRHTLEQLGILYTDENRQFAFISKLYQLLDVLFPAFLVPVDHETPGENLRYVEKRIESIRQYIDQHYHLPVFLQDLADEMFLSPQYLSKFMGQYMGITFNKYLNKVRLQHAFDELINTGHSIAEIAFNNGFSNASAFNKLFREVYEVSPTSYRKEHAQSPKSAETGHFFSENTEKPGSGQSEPLHISFRDSEEYYPSWLDTINIGVLSNALSVSLHDALLSAQKKLHFRYVRFENIFDYNIMEYLPDTEDYNFANLDMIFDFFRSAHLIPFIDVCYKPPKTSLTPEAFRSPEELFAPEKPLPEVLHALEALFKHYIYRYGESEVSKWRFEIWAKHDEDLKYLETPQEYWDKFSAIRHVVKKYLPDCAVGGPGFNTASNMQQFEALIQEMKKRQIVPDFFSIYIYCYAPGEYVHNHGQTPRNTFLSLSTDPDFPSNIFDQYKKILTASAPEDVPLYVTEFNSGIYGLNYIAASAFQAAFICRQSLALFRKTSCIAYWYFADISFDIVTDPLRYATGMGLLEQHGIPNAGYFAYELLSRLKNRLVTAGPGYIAATNGRNKYQVLTCCYTHYNYNFCFTYNQPLPIGNTYEVFEDADVKQTRIHMHDLPTGRYKCMLYVLNRSYGSILDKFIHILNHGKTSPSELEFLIMNMQAEEIDYYRKEANPRLEISYLTNTSGTLSFTLEMEPHAVILINLEKQFE